MEPVTLDTLFALFDERDRVLVKCNQLIVDILAPTVLTALTQIFELAPTDVKIKAIDIVDEALVIDVILLYAASSTLSIWLQRIDSGAEQLGDMRKRLVRMSVPLNIALSQPAVIVEYLTTMHEKQEGNVPINKQASSDEFDLDISELSKDQLQQLMLFKGVVPEEKQ